MPLTVNEQYAAAAACFVGGILSVVTHLWMLFDFLPAIKIPKAVRTLHYHLSILNLLVVLLFFVGAVSHFEQRWIFGPLMCRFYVFWCKFTPIAAASMLAVTLYAEFQRASSPERKDASYGIHALLAWCYGLLWGGAALMLAKHGQEPAGFTCTVIWYQVHPYVTYMSLLGFGLPMMLAAFYAFRLWSSGALHDNPLAKAVCGLFLTMGLQFSAYAVGYAVVCFGRSLSLYEIAFPQVWTKTLGILHPFVYSNVFASKGVKRD